MGESNKKINLLICTQKVDKNDPILGFFHEWIKEFSKYCDKLTIICLEKGDYDLPENVKVLSLGKEKKVSKIKYVFNFYKYIFQEKNNYDSVFVHMNPEYICLGGFFWRFWRKSIALWYMHKKVNLKLKIAEKLTHRVFSATKESFRLKTNKLKITGHGIALEKFKYNYNEINKEEIKFINIGRLSSIKKVEDLIEFAKKVEDKNIDFNFKIIGAFSNDEYENKIKNLVQKYNLGNNINFIGVVSNQEVDKYLQEADIFIHSGNTGSLDKSILEAMLSGLICFTNNDSSKNIFQENDLEILNYENTEELMDNFEKFLSFDENKKKDISLKLKNIVSEKHNLKRLILKIKNELSS